MEILRTPEECFQGLAEYPFEPHYVEIDSGAGPTLRIHYVDEGPRDGEIVLCMHGQPTWSYLYRHMIPHFTAAGYRVIAPDLVGFGRSDKPASTSDYTYAGHVGWMSQWLEALDLDDLTLVCQDWGGLIGLRLVAAFPERFARVVVANTGLPDAQGLPPEMAGPMRALLASIEVPTAQELGRRFREPRTGTGILLLDPVRRRTARLPRQPAHAGHGHATADGAAAGGLRRAVPRRSLHGRGTTLPEPRTHLPR
jgi:haloalkane dehalogenase